MQFDYYSSSLSQPFEACVAAFADIHGSAFDDAEPIPRYPQGSVHRPTNIRLYTAPNRDPFFVSSGSSAKIGAEFCRSFQPGHLPSRIDVAYDFDKQGGFDEIADIVIAICREKRVSVSFFGDPDPSNTKGRTWYLGSRTSDVRVRLYEKGLKEISEGRSDVSPYWSRLELQVRPRKGRRVVASGASEAELWGFSQWTREVSQAVCASVVPFVPDASLKVPDYERSVLHMVHQYAKPMRAFTTARGRRALHSLIDRAIQD